MADLFQTINSKKISFANLKLEPTNFKNKLDLLDSAIARKQKYIDKKDIVYKKAKSLFEALELIYSSLMWI